MMVSVHMIHVLPLGHFPFIQPSSVLFFEVANTIEVSYICGTINVICKRKAHIPPETGFALGIQCEGTGNKHHEIYMPNANPTLMYQHDMVYPTQNSCDGGLDQCEAPMRVVLRCMGASRKGSRKKCVGEWFMVKTIQCLK